MSAFYPEAPVVADGDSVGRALVTHEIRIAEFVLRIAFDDFLSSNDHVAIAAQLHHVLGDKISHQIGPARLYRRGICQAPLSYCNYPPLV